ncbi:MAG: methyltransferase domain-containing protein [Leptolyngbya sp. SIO1D8]|nr:methyltransferase domain-containing protein [Leptolyngbya sp. SIO1D8]
MNQAWQPNFYQDKHSFVWQLGQGVLDLLNPRPGEHILDLGCGTGQLTQAIADRGATVIGLDADPAMISTAQQNFPSISFSVADAREFSLATPVDAIFSNAVFHWIPEQTAVIARLWAALKPGGRLAVEFGGKGNMAGVITAIAAARDTLGYGAASASAWYFPTISEYTSLLEHQGFEVTFASLFDRPTPLNGEAGLTNWLHMFGRKFLTDLSPEQQAELLRETEDKARPKLYEGGQWWADYRRIRVLAHKPYH